MASKSGGVVPVFKGIVDANQAMAILQTMNHWSATKNNRTGGVPTVSISITHAGYRVTAQRQYFVDAVNAAMSEMAMRDAPKLRITR
jgi:hypothetical protein